MSTPKSLASYDDCREHFEAALASTRGIAVTLTTSAEAIRFIQRANAFRVLLRQMNKKVYPEDHPSYGICDYDKFKVAKDPDNPLRVLIKPYDQKVTQVEEL